MKELSTEIDFADSYYISFEMIEGNLTIYLNSWEEKTIELKFFHTIRFAYKAGSYVTGLFEMTDKTSFYSESMSSHYEIIPEIPPFKEYAIMDIHKNMIFHIIAERIEVLLN